jgi:hypothetical protein
MDHESTFADIDTAVNCANVRTGDSNVGSAAAADDRWKRYDLKRPHATDSWILDFVLQKSKFGACRAIPER